MNLLLRIAFEFVGIEKGKEKKGSMWRIEEWKISNWKTENISRIFC